MASLSSLALPDALEARTGIICAVGAGGKKTTLYRILEQISARVGLTATTALTPVPPALLDAQHVAAPEELMRDVPEAAGTALRVGFACPGQKPGRYGGVPPDAIAEIHARSAFEATLVKADGARMRGIKAPRPDEPLLVPGCCTVLFLVSADVIGQPLDASIAHRIPELSALLDLAPGQPITPEHIGRLLSEPAGARQHVGTARLIGVINKVDDASRLDPARRAARAAFAGHHPPDRVVLTAMTAAQPVIEILEPADATPGSQE
ncbi:selenium cofactor biosynthesis protein YqeC [Spiribacter vilamensis]|uniref:Putative selenium-dependent hydroxylase accessory protein YqeC n=1 Tax=Spiribacter vilamensis TaxID=531306 RepID=A0A4Q8CYW3_9GAMM|nr:selenium cofactor biosynthesis protein YqeC [Spiribacter vilamensis]RZU98142.1 putative selenium-dependent hydroxylase accessory protein YqeC [Spiribacter vilamensis]TVO60957.1 putative selenium-dependent hydroxylase accessory protein YqeC [Spiribacter vilamensis]